MFLIYRVTSHDHMFKKLFEFMGHNPTKFGGRRYCGSRDTVFLVCHVISQNHLITVYYMHRSP